MLGYRIASQNLERGNPVHTGKLNIHKDEVRKLRPRKEKSVFGRLGLRCPIPVKLKDIPDEFQVLLIVFDDED